MNNSSTDYSSTETASKILWGFFSPILLFVGVTGNCLVITILVFKRKEVVNSSIIFRSVLAVTDMIILCTVLTKYWAQYVIDVDMRSVSSFGCQFNLFITYVSMQYSAWIIVVMTIQRCLLIHRPFTFKRLWTTNVSVIVLVCVFIFLALVDCHYFFTNEVQKNNCVSKNEEIEHFEDFVFVFIDLAFLCLIPFVFMLVGNIYFMLVMKRQSNFRRSLTEGQRNANTGINQRTARMTRLVMKLTWLFLATTLPICIEMIVDSVYKTDNDSLAALDLAKTICYLIQLTGISLNVCIYINCDNNFRQQLGVMFNCYRRKDWSRGSGSNCVSSICSFDSERETAFTSTRRDTEKSLRKPSQANNAAVQINACTHDSERETTFTSTRRDTEKSLRKPSQANNTVTHINDSEDATQM
ncbi:apelin receptor [Octopus bimaculoides]|uniref:G-protein coupled receptors family 1 profile domain-containing protein n=1 Tax=Octopus bimaculoides TaxID=37653 RepID=A0A0L8GLA8_OCTBM|nr:apelin receptor [Octopus bimaculoides]XP_052825792.1 apelin receptor [Octopus bimaculoides]|eukprot:XP_014779953.1 PREDICTED: apelin receptor-like [Octopus bimaculoides]